MSVPTAISEMSVFCNLGRTPWVYRAFSYQRLFADAEKGPMQIALGQSDISEFESYMASPAVRSPNAGRRRPVVSCVARIAIALRDRLGLALHFVCKFGAQCPEPRHDLDLARQINDLTAAVDIDSGICGIEHHGLPEVT